MKSRTYPPPFGPLRVPHPWTTRYATLGACFARVAHRPAVDKVRVELEAVPLGAGRSGASRLPLGFAYSLPSPAKPWMVAKSGNDQKAMLSRSRPACRPVCRSIPAKDMA